MYLYLTADKIGGPSGGSTVTHHESEALRSLGPCEVWGRDHLRGQGDEPWAYDKNASEEYFYRQQGGLKLALAHVYAGTFTETVESLQRRGCTVTYTAAAHDKDASRREHEKLGIPYEYPHLTDLEQWKRYVGGYLAADVLICPSKHSADVMRSYGAKKRIDIIPHGVDVPVEVKPLPKRFVVGYLGALGPDKGVRYLLEAWKRLNYKDAVLVLAGRDSTSDWARLLYHSFGIGSNVHFAGWQKDVSNFYNAISLYVQPSVSEGWGIEVLEAMAHGRPVICSNGAGAVDAVPYTDSQTCRAGDVAHLAAQIDKAYSQRSQTTSTELGQENRKVAEKFTWTAIHERYTQLWRGLL